jgi:tRNA A37 N6-isopentenylltransferase MiaA
LTGSRTPILNGYDVRCFFVKEDRIDLYRTIDKRCEEMINSDESINDELQSLLNTSEKDNLCYTTKKVRYDTELNGEDRSSAALRGNLVGLFGEAAALVLSGALSPTTPVAKAIGYRQVRIYSLL